MIKAVAFDWGGVIEIMEGGLIQNIVKYLGVSEKEWHKIYFSFNYLSNLGQKSYGEVFALTAKEFGASNEQIAYIHEALKKNKETKKINFELVEIMKDLKKKGYKIGLLSNNNFTKLKRELTDLDLIDLFDAVVVSSEVGYQKPQPEIFHILFDRLGIKSDEVVFVDDTESSLSGSENIGYTPLLFTSNQKLKGDLQKLDINI